LSSIYPIYEQRHFSGIQSSIYIGDDLIDEALSVEYQVSQRKTPIYGYASQLFDVVAPGPVIVQGSLTVNYIEAGYLWVVLNRYKKLTKVLSVVQELSGHSPNTISAILTSQLSGMGVSVQDLALGNVSNIQRSDFIATLARTASKDASTFQAQMDLMEAEIWGSRTNELDNQARRADDNDFDDVEIYVVHGDLSDPNAPSTARRISGVHFLSCAQQVTPDGEPQIEQYSFLARNVH